MRSEPEALLLEGKLIKEYQPRYNISFRDDKRFLLIKVNLNDPIPRFMLARLRQDDGARYFGPFVAFRLGAAHADAGPAQIQLARLPSVDARRGGLQALPLRPSQILHRARASATFRARITCGRCWPRAIFWPARPTKWKRELEEQMKKAAAAEDFEKAAQFRDALEDLRRTTQKTRQLQTHALQSARRPRSAAGPGGIGAGSEFARRAARIEGFDISNISGTFAVASMVSFRDGKPDRSNYRRFRIKTVTGQDDFACMAETVRRRYSRLREARRRRRAAGFNCY